MRPELLLASLILTACGGASPAPRAETPVAMVVVPEAEPEEEPKAEKPEPEPEPHAPPKREEARLDVIEAELEPDDSAMGAILKGGGAFGGSLTGGPGSGFGTGSGSRVGVGGGSGGGSIGGLIGRGPASPQSSAKVTAGTVSVRGQLPPEIVRRVLRARRSRIRACYRTQLKTTPKLSGTMNIQFAIAANGRVISAQVTALESSLDSCVKRALERARFPHPRAGIVSVSYRLTFSPN